MAAPFAIPESYSMKRILALPLFWKILAPAGLSILCLLVYLGFSTFVFNSNNGRLQAVRRALPGAGHDDPQRRRVG